MQPASSSSDEVEKKGAVEAATGLLGGEISAETFDADAYLLEAVGFSPDSKCCSPANARATSRNQWFDADLDLSLSPLLTPSLRHALRTLRAM